MYYTDNIQYYTILYYTILYYTILLYNIIYYIFVLKIFPGQFEGNESGFGGFDSGRSFILGGGVPGSVGDLPEIWSPRCL